MNFKSKCLGQIGQKSDIASLMFHNAIQSTKFIQSSQHFQSQKLYLLSPITVNTEFFINSRHFVLVSRQVTGKGNGVKRLFEGGQQLSCTRVLLDVHNPPQKEEDLQILSVTMIIQVIYTPHNILFLHSLLHPVWGVLS